MTRVLVAPLLVQSRPSVRSIINKLHLFHTAIAMSFVLIAKAKPIQHIMSFISTRQPAIIHTHNPCLHKILHRSHQQVTSSPLQACIPTIIPYWVDSPSTFVLTLGVIRKTISPIVRKCSAVKPVRLPCFFMYS